MRKRFACLESPRHVRNLIQCSGVCQCRLYTVSQKNKTPNSCPQLYQILADSQNSFNVRLSRKFVTKRIQIPHHTLNLSLHYLVKYECRKMASFWNSLRIAINDESQRSIANNLRRDELLYYTYIIHSAGEKNFKISSEHLVKLWAKSLTVIYPIRLALLSSKMQISPDKLNNLWITHRNCY